MKNKNIIFEEKETLRAYLGYFWVYMKKKSWHSIDEFYDLIDEFIKGSNEKK